MFLCIILYQIPLSYHVWAWVVIVLCEYSDVPYFHTHSPLIPLRLNDRTYSFFSLQISTLSIDSHNTTEVYVHTYDDFFYHIDTLVFPLHPPQSWYTERYLEIPFYVQMVGIQNIPIPHHSIRVDSIPHNHWLSVYTSRTALNKFGFHPSFIRAFSFSEQTDFDRPL